MAIRTPVTLEDDLDSGPADESVRFGLRAAVLVADRRTEYPTYCPHSALRMLTPAEFARQWQKEHQPQLS